MGKQTKGKHSIRQYKGGDTDSPNNMDVTSPPTTVPMESSVSGQIAQENAMILSEDKTLLSYLTVKNIIIVVLALLLILSFLGVNLLLILGRLLQFIAALLGPFITRVVGIFTYTTGTIINGTANIVSSTAKTGIDIADGTAHSIGNLLRNTSNVNGNLPIQMELNADIEGPGPVYIPETIPPLPPMTLPPTMPPTMPPTTVPVTMPPTITPGDNDMDEETPILDAVLNTSPYLDDLPLDDDTSNPIQNNASSNKSSWCLVGNFNNRRGCIMVNDQSMCMSGQVYDSQADCLNLHPSSSPMATPVLTTAAPMTTAPPLPLVPTGINWNAPIPPRPMYGVQQPIPRVMYPVGPVPPLQQQKSVQYAQPVQPRGPPPPPPAYRMPPPPPVGPVMMPGYNGMAPPPILY